MSDLTIKTQIQVGGEDIAVVAERTFTDVELIHDQSYEVQDTTKSLWDTVAVGAQTGFRVLAISSSQPVELELVTENALLERQVNSVPLGKDVALVLSADDALYDYGAGAGADSFTGTLGKVNLLRVREVNDVEAKIRLRLYR